MNILEIIVLVILAAGILLGYWKGLMRMVYSIAAWLLTLAAVVFATPHMADFLENNTGVKEVIQNRCADYLEHMAKEQALQQTEGLGLPGMGTVLGAVLAGSGISEEAAKGISGFIIKGIAFFIVLTAARLGTFWLFKLLNPILKVPVWRGPDRILGAAAGFIMSLALVWILFYIISLCAISDFGIKYLGYINESRFLKLLYDSYAALP